MKATFVLATVATLASTGSAMPMAQFGNGIFGFGGNIFGDVLGGLFDTGACVISSFISGRNSVCFKSNKNGTGNGMGATMVNANAASSASVDANSYNFKYSTNSDGTLKVEIIPNKKGSNPCTYNIDSDGKDIQEIIADAAERCL